MQKVANMLQSETEGQEFEMAATQLARLRRVTGVDEVIVAEIILHSQSSLWRRQAGKWLIEQPKFLSDDMKEVWARASRFVTAVVDRGFDGKMWWRLDDQVVNVPEGATFEQAFVAECVILTDFCLTSKIVAEKFSYIVSPGFEVFAQIIMGPNYVKDYAGLAVRLVKSYESLPAFKRSMLDLDSQFLALVKPGPISYERECINEFCDKGSEGARMMVDLRKRRSGACCKACMTFNCEHPTCAARAEKQGYATYRHYWGTKIAQAHKLYRVGPE